MTEYLAKCDHPLIQEQWKEPKVGDDYFTKGWAHNRVVSPSDASFEFISFEKTEHIWLPRIEDYIRLLMEDKTWGSEINIIAEITSSSFAEIYGSIDTILALFQAFYMSEVHGLTWNGSEWE